MRLALRILLPIIVIAVGGYAAFTMIQNRPAPETQAVEIPPPSVRVIVVQPKNVRLKVRAEGTVAPRTETELVPEVSGRVMMISESLAAGGFFEDGEVLLKIDRREYELAVVRARAAIAQAELKLATEEEEAAVARMEWVSLGQGEPPPLVVRVPQIAEAEAMLASAEAAFEQAEYDLERTVVKAPYAGRVREKRVDVGQFVSRGSSIARLYSVDYAEVRLPIPDKDLAYVNLPLAYRGQKERAAGLRVTLMANFAGKRHRWQGRIVRTEGEIDPRTRMVQAIAQVDDPYGKARPGRPPLAVGMFVEAEIDGNTAANVFVLPRIVLRSADQVLVVDKENRLRFRTVDILRTENDQVIIRSGLEAGEHVGISVVEAAVDGMKVHVLEETAETAG